MKILLVVIFLALGIIVILFGSRKINVKNKFSKDILSSKFGEGGVSKTGAKIYSWGFGVILISIGFLILFWPK